MRERLPRAGPWLALVLILALALGAAAGITLAVDLPSAESDFNLAGWEVRHIGGKWLYHLARFFQGGLSEEEKDAKLQRFLALNAEIAELERLLDQALLSGDMDHTHSIESTLRERRAERDRLENHVEAVLEERVSEVLSELGLESSLPLFLRATWLFPPVDTEFDAPPQVLVLSPRDRILLESRRPLRSDLPLDAILRLESEEEAGGLSALVVSVSGSATYPSVVQPNGDYLQTLELVAHEWLHQYLFFKPLGRRYFESDELTTLNETVASMAGGEIASLVAERYPLDTEASNKERSEPADGIDLDRELRALRIEVESLLSEGKIEQAERLMEERRRSLERHGFRIRKINQAFFAFYGLYADTPLSISPIGPNLEELRRRSASLGEFIRAAADLTSEEDLDRLLAQEPPTPTRP